jgi:hypothetical protein
VAQKEVVWAQFCKQLRLEAGSLGLAPPSLGSC